MGIFFIFLLDRSSPSFKYLLAIFTCVDICSLLTFQTQYLQSLWLGFYYLYLFFYLFFYWFLRVILWILICLVFSTVCCPWSWNITYVNILKKFLKGSLSRDFFFQATKDTTPLWSLWTVFTFYRLFYNYQVRLIWAANLFFNLVRIISF